MTAVILGTVQREEDLARERLRDDQLAWLRTVLGAVWEARERPVLSRPLAGPGRRPEGLEAGDLQTWAGEILDLRLAADPWGWAWVLAPAGEGLPPRVLGLGPEGRWPPAGTAPSASVIPLQEEG